MFKTIFLFFLYSVEMLVVFTYAKSIFEYKKNARLSFSISIGAYLTVFLIYSLLTKDELVHVGLTIAANFVIFRTAFTVNSKSAIFHTVVLGVVQLMTEFISVYAISAIVGGELNDFRNNMHIFMLDAVISKLLYMYICKIISMSAVKENKSGSWGRYSLLAIMPLSSIILVMIVRVLTSRVEISNGMNIVCILSTAFLLFANIVVFVVYENAQKNNQRILKMEIANQKDDLDLSYLELLEKKNECMQILVHDIKNHLQSISGLADSNEISDYITQIYGNVEKFNTIGKTKNKMLDLIISKYVTICEKKGIEFQVENYSENLSFIQDSHLSTLLNNLLDNAVEAVDSLEEKHIRLTLSFKFNNFHTINIENTCEKEPLHFNGQLLTTKTEKGVHGVGTKSIQKIITQYSGESQWYFDEKEKIFRQVILFPKQDDWSME